MKPLAAIIGSRIRKSAGFSLIECLVAAVILAIAALAVTHGTIYSLAYAKRSLRQSIAAQLAQSKMEELAAVDPTTLDGSDDLTEDPLIVNSISFTRQTTVTVNANSSRTVVVTVAPNNADLGSPVTLQSNFALWGNS